jgi:hypothetical protein
LVISTQAKKSNIISEKPINVSMAGYGDPGESFSGKRNGITMALHNGFSIEDIAVAFNMTEQQIKDEINPLIEINLIINKGEKYIPDFFVANQDEAERILLFSKTIGVQLADTLIKEWEIIENTFSKLSFSNSYTLKEQGFMFVGSRILDMGVLEALNNDKSLLLPAPIRPSPLDPNWKYYFWMIEGDNILFSGRYGQENYNLRFKNWRLLNFGQYSNERYSYLDKILGTFVSDTINNTEALAKISGIPYINKEDTKTWEAFSSYIASKMLVVLKEKDEDVKKVYKTLNNNKDSDKAYYDFYSWYYHLVYAWAIDELIAREKITIPEVRHSSIIMYKDSWWDGE